MPFIRARLSVCVGRRVPRPAGRTARQRWLPLCLALWGMCGGACTTTSWHDTWKRNLAALERSDAGALAENSSETAEPSSPSDVEPASYEAPVPPHLDAHLAADALPQSLSLEAVIQYTLANHPMLAARRNEIEIAKGELISAGAFDNPQLVMDAEGPVDGDAATDLSVRLEFTIPTAGKRRLAQAAARARIRSAEFALGEETDRVVAEAADAALEVLYLQELAAVQAHLERLARQSAEVQKQRLAQGVVTEIDSLSAEVDAVDVESDRLATVTRLESSRLRLARAMGLGTPQPMQVEGALTVEYVPPVLPLETVLNAARQTRPELARAGADVGRRRQELALAKALSHPDFQIGPRYAESFDDPGDSAGMRFSTEIPIFDMNEGGICSSAAELRLANALFDVAQIASLNDVAAAFVQLAPIESRLSYFERDVVPLMTRAEQTIAEAQAANVVDAVQLSQQMRILARLRLSHLELRYLHTRIRTRLELLLGAPLDEIQQHGFSPPDAELIPPPSGEPHAAGTQRQPYQATIRR